MEQPAGFSEDEPRALQARARRSRRGRELLFAILIVGVSTGIALALRPYLAATNLAMLYLLGVVAIAMRCGRGVSVFASFLSVAAFDYFCVEPYLTFVVSDYQYVITFGGMLAVALVIGTQTVRIRMQAEHAVEREARTAALYRLSRTLSGETRVFEAARAAATLAEEVFRTNVVIFLSEDRKLSFRRRTSDQLPVPKAEEPIAQWVFDNGHKAGKGFLTHAEATAFYLPLRGARRIVGVMGVLPDDRGDIFSPEQQDLLEVFASQTGLTIERSLSQHAAEETRVQIQTEQMRSSLLSAVSHDLRTPLASITGAASTLRSQSDKLPIETRHELLDSISEEAERLSRLVRNLLEMTRFESGAVELRRDLYPLEEIVGAALQRMESQLEGRQITIRLPDSLPLVYVDDVLMGQVVLNLLENALKYSPAETPIDVEAEADVEAVTLEVRDRGAGFVPGEEERVFEKFYRGKPERAKGAGLGLAICRAIVTAHQGMIHALNRNGGGAILRIRLPLGSGQ